MNCDTLRRNSCIICLIFANRFVIILRATAGCVFDSEVAEAELAFDYAVEIVNNEILAPSGAKLLDGVHLKVPYSNEYLVSRKLCRLLKVRNIRTHMHMCAKIECIRITSACI